MSKQNDETHRMMTARRQQARQAEINEANSLRDQRIRAAAQKDGK